MTQLYVAASVSILMYNDGIRCHHYVTWSGILPTTASPWRHLYENGDEVSFLNLTGFSREAFEEMHQYLYENVEEHYGAGRPRLLNTRDELGLILFYLGSPMKYSELCLIFGCTRTRNINKLAILMICFTSFDDILVELSKSLVIKIDILFEHKFCRIS